jgi:hypothetical protein
MDTWKQQPQDDGQRSNSSQAANTQQGKSCPAQGRWEPAKQGRGQQPTAQPTEKEIDKSVIDTFPASDPTSLQTENPPEVGQQGSTVVRAKSKDSADVDAATAKTKNPVTTGMPIEKTKPDAPREREDGGGLGG